MSWQHELREERAQGALACVRYSPGKAAKLNANWDQAAERPARMSNVQKWQKQRVLLLDQTELALLLLLENGTRSRGTPSEEVQISTLTHFALQGFCAPRGVSTHFRA